MSDQDPIRELAGEIADAIVGAVREALEGEGGDVHAVPIVEGRLRAFLAERKDEQASQLAALRSALELLHDCCDHVYYRREDRGHAETYSGPYHPSRKPWLTVEAALATDAGKREAEVLRAAREVRAQADGRWMLRSFQDAVLRLFDRVDAMDAAKETPAKETP